MIQDWFGGLGVLVGAWGGEIECGENFGRRLGRLRQRVLSMGGGCSVYSLKKFIPPNLFVFVFGVFFWFLHLSM